MSKSRLEIEVNVCNGCIRKVSALTGALQKNAADSTESLPHLSHARKSGRASAWVWPSLQSLLCAAQWARGNITWDLEDQTLSQGCRYPAVALGSGMHILSFWIHLQNIRQCITVMLDYQNCNACLSVKIFLSTSVLSYAGVTASQTNTKVFRKWSEMGSHGFRAELCKHGGSDCSNTERVGVGFVASNSCFIKEFASCDQGAALSFFVT